jgi:hypothetical protein
MMIYFGAGDFPVAYGYWMVKMGISLSKKNWGPGGPGK